jgi:hypothetical protein
MRVNKFLFVFAILTSVFSVISAETTVSTIAEIKKLDDGTSIVFEGSAITTYHQGELAGIVYGTNGILMQDSTGVILLNNKAFKANSTTYTDPTGIGYLAHVGGTEITKIVGTFKKATSDLPDRIEFSGNSELRKVTTGTHGNRIPYKKVALSDFLASPKDYELLAVSIIVDRIYKEGSSMYLRSGNKEMPIKSYFNLQNVYFPYGGIFDGFCELYKGAYRFAIEERKFISPSSFGNIVDVYNFTDDSNRSLVSKSEIEILEPVVVNHVETEADKVNYYVQSSYLSQNRGLVFSVDKNSDIVAIQAGDSIVGLKGYYNKYVYDGNEHIATTFNILKDNVSRIKVHNTGNSNVFKESTITTILGAPSEYEAQLISLPRGTIKKYDENYFFSTYNSLRKQYDSICVVMNDDTDLSIYANREVIVGGLFKIFKDQPKLLIRSSKDIITDNLVFESIGAMLSAGRPISSSIICEISNPVLVTYKYANDEKGMYGLYLQDATGAILYKTNQSVDTINPGDLIDGIKGTFSYNVQGYEAHYLKEDTTASLSVSTHNNEVIATSVTLEQIVNAPMQYASRVVEIKDLETITKFGISQGSPYETEFIYQNGAMMNVLWDNLYDNMSVVGVVEYGIMGYGLTIFPIEVENTTKEFDGTCRRIKDIRKLEAGTEFTYVGEATTTFTDFENGILIQDYTGGILLKNIQLSDSTTSEIKSGMIITNIKGKFQPASEDILSSIEISDEDIAKIEVKEKNVDFECRSTDANALTIFYEKYYEGEALMFYNATVVEDNGKHMLSFKYSLDGEDFDIRVPMMAKDSIDILKVKDFVGYARKFSGVLTIVVVDVKSYYEDEDPGQDPGQDPEDPEDPPIQDDVENIKVVRSLFITETGELFAPEATSLVVYDVNGRVVASASSSQLCVASLSRGIYLVRSVYSDASVQVTKIVK